MTGSATNHQRLAVAPAPARVFFVQYANPAAYPPIEHGATLVAEAGGEVLLLGTTRLAESLRFGRHPRIRVDLVEASAPGWRQKLHYARFVVRALSLAIRFRPTALYVSDPLAAPIGWLFTLVSRVPVMYHEHDAPEPDGAESVFMRVVMAARRALALRAHTCVLPNHDRARLFRDATGRSGALVVPNTPLRREVVAPREPPAGQRLRILYHGSIVAWRVPLAVLEALARLPASVTMRVLGYEPEGGQHIARLRAAAVRLGVVDRLEIVPPVPRSELLRHAADCDAGLALVPAASSSPNERFMVGASNKAFEYLACGLPLIVTDVPAWRETFVVPGYALACDPESPASLELVMRRWLDHPSERWEMGERGRRRVQEEWHYDGTFAPVLRRLLAPVAATPYASAASAEA